MPESLRARHSAAIAAAMFLLWLVFVAGFKGQEMLVGALCTFLSAAFIAFVWAARPAKISLRRADIAQIIHVPGSILRDAGVVCRVLWRDLTGRRKAGSSYIVHRFEASERDRLKRAREVLAVTYMTASPNTIVLGVDQRARLLLLHQLEATPLPAMARARRASEQTRAPGPSARHT